MYHTLFIFLDRDKMYHTLNLLKFNIDILQYFANKFILDEFYLKFFNY